MVPRLKSIAVSALTPILVGLSSVPARAEAVDEDAAVELARKSNCLKCHSVTRKKNAPSYQSIAEKYKAKADAEGALFKHLSSRAKITVDGTDEYHPGPETQDQAQIRNLVHWILTR